MLKLSFGERYPMNKQELNNQLEVNDFSDELTDEALDRARCENFGCNPSAGQCVVTASA